MKTNETVRYYCFNRNCKSSILNTETCIVLEVPLARALTESIYCQECFDELVSKEVLDLKMQLNELMIEKQWFKTMIIDDDPVYHIVFKELTKNSAFLKEVKHYRDGLSALNYLCKEETDIPDLIFLDINMPRIDAWEFLDELENNRPDLIKNLRVYLISSEVLPSDNERSKSYKCVKAVITKPFDRRSYKDFSLALQADLCA